MTYQRHEPSSDDRLMILPEILPEERKAAVRETSRIRWSRCCLGLRNIPSGNQADKPSSAHETLKIKSTVHSDIRSDSNSLASVIVLNRLTIEV